MSTTASYSEVVFENVREEILSGKLRPGGRLLELEVAERMGTSQGPVREAFARLREQRLIVTERHRGSFVAEISAKEARDAADARRVLEPHAASLAMVHLADRDFATLEKNVRAAVQAARKRDLNKQFFHDMAFHRVIFEATGSPTLLQFWGYIESLTRQFVMSAAPMVFGDPEEVAQTHEVLLTHLHARDSAAYGEAIDAHIMRIWWALDAHTAMEVHETV